MENEVEIKCKSCSKEVNDKINVSRFIDSLDRFFKTDDLIGAKSHIEYWEKEAKSLNDNRGLLSIVNEALGLSRRLNDSNMGLQACKEALELLNINNLENNYSGATVLVNIATTYNCFGNCKEAINLYNQAIKIYENEKKTSTYEFASLLNNKATTLSNLARYEEAKKCLNKAIDILKIDGKHDGEIAVSLINLAHCIFDNDHKAFEEVEQTLDLAWDYINSKRLVHDQNYAFIISKCAPSLMYFKRIDEANALIEVANEIYGK